MSLEDLDFETIITQPIPLGSRREVIVLLSLTDAPGKLVLFQETDDTRSLDLLDEQEAYAKIAVVEERRQRFSLTPAEQHIISDLTKKQLKEIVRRAHPKMPGNLSNRNYILNRAESF